MSENTAADVQTADAQTADPGDPGETDEALESAPEAATAEAESPADLRPARVIVVGPDGQPLATAVASGEDEEPSEPSVADLIEQPAKVMRVGSMIKQLLEEVRNSPLDDAARARLRDIHTRSIKELESGLAPELIDELERLSLPFGSEETPTDAELRIAQAQLVGWLEGLFHGIQTALFAQQMAARAQLEQMRRPAITAEPSGPLGGPGSPRSTGTSGPYL